MRPCYVVSFIYWLAGFARPRRTLREGKKRKIYCSIRIWTPDLSHSKQTLYPWATLSAGRLMSLRCVNNRGWRYACLHQNGMHFEHLLWKTTHAKSTKLKKKVRMLHFDIQKTQQDQKVSPLKKIHLTEDLKKMYVEIFAYDSWKGNNTEKLKAKE